MVLQFTGLVIGSKNNGDVSRTAEIFTPEGIVYVYASGARRLSSRFMPLTNVFSLVSVECNESNGLNTLKDGKPLALFGNISKSIEKFNAAAGVISSMRVASRNSEEKQKMYSLLLTYIKELDEADDSEKEIYSLTVKLYIYLLCCLGYDVYAEAEEAKGSECLLRVLDGLSGRKVSDAMTDKARIPCYLEAFATLEEIYRRQLDMGISFTM